MHAFRPAATAQWTMEWTVACWLLASSGAWAQTAADPSEPVRVTTDTPEFCRMLAGEVADRQRARLSSGTGMSPDVPMLESEGRQMCTEGHVRAGIVRLRMAWTLLHDQPK